MPRSVAGMLGVMRDAFHAFWHFVLRICIFLLGFVCHHACGGRRPTSSAMDLQVTSLCCICSRRRRMKSSDVELQMMDFENTQGTSTVSVRLSSHTNSVRAKRSSGGNGSSPTDGDRERTPLNRGAGGSPARRSVGEEVRKDPGPGHIEPVTSDISETRDKQGSPPPIHITGTGVSEFKVKPGPSTAIAVTGTPVDETTFPSDNARRTFLERNDEYSENEIITLCKTLNGRIGHLSGHLIREKNRLRGLQQDKQQAETRNPADKPNADPDSISELAQVTLGPDLVRDLYESRMNARSSAAVDHSIRDGLDAWSIYCVHLAMTPMLFGLKLRTDDEISCIIESMEKLEPDLAQHWTLTRDQYRTRDKDTEIKSLEAIRRLERLFVDDKLSKGVQNSKYANLERIYQCLTREAGPNNPLQIPLHWRALLHAHELQQGSYKDAISQTERILRDGLLRIFTMAGIQGPDIANNASLSGLISNIVRDAATLAKYTKTSVFSQNIGIVTVDPGKSYDEATMCSEDKPVMGKVKCTVQFGLRATDTDKNEKWLLKTEVLLA